MEVFVYMATIEKCKIVDNISSRLLAVQKISIPYSKAGFSSWYKFPSKNFSGKISDGPSKRYPDYCMCLFLPCVDFFLLPLPTLNVEFNASNYEEKVFRQELGQISQHAFNFFNNKKENGDRFGMAI